MSNEVTMLEFDEIPWSNRNLRGKEFGTRSNARFSAKGDEFVIHCRTGRKPESRINVRVLLHGGAWWKPSGAVFSDQPYGTGTSIDMNGMFMSESGKDEWPSKGFDGKLNYRPDSQCLKPDTDYYIHVKCPAGHPSIKPGCVVYYTSTMTDDVDEIAPVGEPMIHPITGESGMWYPDVE